MKLTLSTLISLTILSVFGQEPAANDSTPKNWKLKAIYGLNGTQTSFVNWNAGGRNNISVLGYVSSSANYAKGKFTFDNSLDLALGGLQYIDKGSTEGLQKTDDKIDFSTKAGYEFREKWYYSFIGAFRTQMLDGFIFPDTIRSSTFMAPAYATIALGIDYKPSDNFSAFVSPLASKMTIVNDKVLADAGAFGVTGAEFDGLGNVVTAGKRFRGEFGAYAKFLYNVNLAKNIDMKSKLELFSNYMENPQNIDVNADILWSFKVNSWFSASLNWTLIYDDDIDIRTTNGFGPRTQFKSVLGLGVSYTMRNFTEK